MSDDLIKKEEAKEAVCKGCLKDWGICQHHWDCPMLTNLEMLPSADRPQGEWIALSGMQPPELHGKHYCSNCGHILHLALNGGVYDYCPNCGADMRKGADDE